jgi:hypothetical protein
MGAKGARNNLKKKYEAEDSQIRKEPSMLIFCKPVYRRSRGFIDLKHLNRYEKKINKSI